MKFSLGKKVVLLIVSVSVILCGIAIYVSYRVTDSMNSTHYMGRANEIAATVARVVDADDARKVTDAVLAIYAATDDKVRSDEWGSPAFEAYAGLYGSIGDMPECQRLMAQLKRLQEVNGVDCLYLSVVVPADDAFVYVLDAAEEDPCPIGCIDPLYELNAAVIDDPTRGFPAYLTNTEEYGWLVTAGAPIYDEAGEVVCYAMDDISMDVIKEQEHRHMRGLSLVLVSLTLGLCVLAAYLVRRSVTDPLNKLATAATCYCDPSQSSRSTFEGLNIHTKDEIEELYNSMQAMEHDIDSHIDRLVETRAELQVAKLEANKMNVLAHHDALTGIRNKLAYDQEVWRLDEELREGQAFFGIAIVDLNDLKVTNDTYGHDRGDESIRQLTNLICMTFKHSSVFRVGGDEFAIVLRDEDGRNAEHLVAEFRAHIDALARSDSPTIAPWERVSAAIGYAMYDPDLDSSAGDVFRRADKDMYTHKSQMKHGTVR